MDWLKLVGDLALLACMFGPFVIAFAQWGGGTLPAGDSSIKIKIVQ